RISPTISARARRWRQRNERHSQRPRLVFSIDRKDLWSADRALEGAYSRSIGQETHGNRELAESRSRARPWPCKRAGCAHAGRESRQVGASPWVWSTKSITERPLQRPRSRSR